MNQKLPFENLMSQNITLTVCAKMRLLQLNTGGKKLLKKVSGTPAIIHKNAVLSSIMAYQVQTRILHSKWNDV